MDHIWRKKDVETGVDVSIVVVIPEDRLPNYEECKATIELLDRATTSFSAIMREFKPK